MGIEVRPVMFSGGQWRREHSTPRTEDLLRELAPQVLGVLVRRYGQFEECEDAVQEAVLAAAVAVAGHGVPANPRGWLITIASRRLIDQIRSDRARRARETTAAAQAPGVRRSRRTMRAPDTDDTLILLFLCCHPALTPGLPDRADPARRRRPDHRRDRPRVPRAGGHHGGADQPGQAAHQGRREPIQPARARRTRASGWASSCTCST